MAEAEIGHNQSFLFHTQPNDEPNDQLKPERGEALINIISEFYSILSQMTS